eukprot:m.234562 g.234562  ORF g.234562 m.234562 type:complete len:131 (-) comp54306_c0_seq10:921-1313(-)
MDEATRRMIMKSRPSVKDTATKFKSIEDERVAKEMYQAEWSQAKSRNLVRANTARADPKVLKQFLDLQDEETVTYKKQLEEIAKRDEELVKLLMEEEEQVECLPTTSTICDTFSGGPASCRKPSRRRSVS